MNPETIPSNAPKAIPRQEATQTKPIGLRFNCNINFNNKLSDYALLGSQGQIDSFTQVKLNRDNTWRATKDGESYDGWLLQRTVISRTSNYTTTVSFVVLRHQVAGIIYE